MKYRWKQIDDIKGIGIFLVVLCHCILLYESNLDISLQTRFVDIVYSFHMPLFFVVTGITLGLKYYSSESCKRIDLGKVLKKLSLRLLVPYFIWSFVYILLEIRKNKWVFPDNIVERCYAVISGRGIAPLWFLIALFLAEVLFILSLKFIGQKFLGKLLWEVLFVLILGILSILAIRIYRTFISENFYLDFPLLAICRVVPTLFFILFGFIIGLRFKKIVELDLKYKVLALLILLLFFSAFQIAVKNHINMHILDIDHMKYFLLTGMLGSMIIIFLSVMLPSRMKILPEIGKQSMIIMFLHYPPIPILFNIRRIEEVLGLPCVFLLESVILILICCSIYQVFRLLVTKIVKRNTESRLK